MQKLAYCGIGAADIEAFKQLTVDILGMMPDERAGVRRLRIDDRSWRFAFHPSSIDDILYVGIDLGTEAALDSMRLRLASNGLTCTEMDAHECAERQVSRGIWLNDPDGLRFELVVDHASSDMAFQSPLVGGFVTGEQGLGHVVLTVSDLNCSIAFFEKLGFSLSDFISSSMGGHQLRVAFLHCNSRHHSLALVAIPGKRLNHVMIEVEEVDDVIQAHRRCLEAKLPVGHIGRHPNDMMLSFYVPTPAGFEIEFGWGGRTIQPGGEVVEYDRFSLWGHR